MTEYIRANVSLMFDDIEPALVSGSRFELGETAGSITWRNALTIAESADRWLESDLSAAVAGVREYAIYIGAWEDTEVAAWSDVYCLAFLVQDVASELRMLGSDEASSALEYHALVRKYERTDWGLEAEYPRHGYYTRRRMYAGRRRTLALVEFYTGY